MKIYKLIFIFSVLTSCALINEDISYKNVKGIVNSLEFDWHFNEKVPYGIGEKEYYIYFEPEEIKSESLIFFIHGGGWNSGAPEDARYLAEYFNSLGYSVILTGYPLIDNATIDEMNQALYKSFNHVKDRYSDTYTSIVLGGASAGGQMAASLYVHSKKNEERFISKLFLLSSVLDFNSCDNFVIQRLIETAFPFEEQRQDFNPITQIDSFKDCDIFLLFSRGDGIVNSRNALLFGEAAEAVGAQVSYYDASDLYHDESYVFPFLHRDKQLQKFEHWLDS